MPNNLFLASAAIVLAVSLTVVLFGVPFHRRAQAAKLELATAAAARKTVVPNSQIAALLATPSATDSISVPEVSQPASVPVKAVQAARAALPKVPPHPQQSVSATPTEPAAPIAQPATLKIEVQHHFAEGKLSLFVDEKLAYSTDLHGEAKRRLAVFHDVQGSDSAEVNVSAGLHTLRINGQSGSHGFDESKTITADFSTGAKRVLHVNFDKNSREMRLVLESAKQ
jgi:hypothetical protein